MKNGSKNRKNGLYEPENAILGTFLRIFGLTAAVLRKTEEKIDSNKGFQATAHNLSAMRWPFFAALAILTARGPSPEP